jgi:FkbM family methyltransferase
VLVLAVHNREVPGSSLVAKLHALGFSRITTLVELYDSCCKELGDRYWLTGRQFYRRFTTEIGQVYELWADETSRETYLDTLEFRVGGDYRVLPEPDLANQYFPADLPAWREPIRLVDCGAYDGDTIGSFLKAGLSLQAVAAFEPDQGNFRKLARFVASPEGTVEEAVLWPCGVSSSTAQLSFASERGEASSLSAGGSLTVQCVSLDEALPAFAPTLIKMDVEGAESDALQGARRIIAEHHPGLAICVYHRPEDLWQVPMLVDQLAKAGGQDHASASASYKYYLRSHAYNSFELVFYAVPV